MGFPAFFIRTYGCPVKCPWCDSAGTWHPTWTPMNIGRFTADELACEAAASGAPVVVVTGGEPCVHDLGDLTHECHKRGLKVHVETSGGFEIKGMVDWITLSPKKWKEPLPVNLLRADEFKIIVEEPADIELYTRMIKMATYNYPHVWLHPEWSKRHNLKVLEAITDTVKVGKGHYRAGWQIHKLYKADLLDPRSEKPVPLGGDMEKGW